jgi:tRNA G10  N-methylase Trm11
LRALDKDGLRPINVLDKFESTLKNKIKYISELNGLENDGLFSKAIVADARNIPEKINNVQLIVTNPPYISSIRYFEVCKLEMYWLQFITEPDEYFSLDKKGVGTERFYKNEYKTFESLGKENIDRISQRIFDAGNNKMSKVVTRFFKDMEKVFCEMHRVLRPKGYIVMKISDSLVRKELIPTHQFLIDIAKSLGFRIIDAFKDKIQNRSLLTKRNYYSGMISHDWILIFQKR